MKTSIHTSFDRECCRFGARADEDTDMGLILSSIIGVSIDFVVMGDGS